jgi:hypothetical protein
LTIASIFHLIRGKIVYIESGAHQALFFRRERHENEGVFARLCLQRLVKAGQKGRAAPVSDNAIAGIYVVKMRSDDDDRVRSAGQGANNVGRF